MKKNKSKNRSQLNFFLYIFIIIFTIITIIILYEVGTSDLYKYIPDINIIQSDTLNLKKIFTQINSGNINYLFNYKIILLAIITITYVCIVQFPIKKLVNKSLIIKQAPIGKKGPRGLRGKDGEDGYCNTCSDNMCYRKTLFHITKTYNYWREIQHLPIISEAYTIKNKYLKNKIQLICNSKEFSKILTKYGSNNKSCPEKFINGEKCGAYDFIFKMWTIWILIILKYKNGQLFLESDSLTDRDFEGLIEKEDSFVNNKDKVTINTNTNTNEYEIINNDNFPFFNIHDKITDTYLNDIHFTELSEISENTWDNMLNTSNKNITITKLDEIINGQQTTQAPTDSNTTNKYKSIGLNDNFFLSSEPNPSRGKYNPFFEIKKYDAWSWGSSHTKPKIKYTKSPLKDPICKTCGNHSLCNTTTQKKIKMISTNNFYEVWKSDNALQKKNINTNYLIPFLQYGNSKISILRAYDYFDENEHIKFKTYKPLGDIIIKDDERANSNTNTDCTLKKISLDDESKIKKEKINYKGPIRHRITNTNIKTILVSGDVKHPIDYKLVFSTTRTEGVDKNVIGFNIWKPIAPDGYMALGYIVDKTPNVHILNQTSYNPTIPTDPTNPTITYPSQIDNIKKPSLNLIYCVPHDDTSHDTSHDIWENNYQDINGNNTIGDKSFPNIKLKRNEYNYSNNGTYDYSLLMINDDSNKNIDINNNICNNENIDCSQIKDKNKCNSPNCKWIDEHCINDNKIPNSPNDNFYIDKKYTIRKIYE
jgi:hypothetical protein